MPEKLIIVNRDPDGVAWIIINRPKSLNSLTRAMMVDLAKGIKSLNADKSVRVIILTGSGRSFCSGVDLTAAEDVFKGDVKDDEANPVAQMELCAKPIIGAIGGFAVTAGFEIALACDILVASKDAKFMDTHARFDLSSLYALNLDSFSSFCCSMFVICKLAFLSCLVLSLYSGKLGKIMSFLI